MKTTVKIIGFGLLAIVIAGVAGGLWTGLLVGNLKLSPKIPWAVPVMALLLWRMWRYLGGGGWPRSTSEARRRYLRANPASAPVYVWAFVAGAFADIAFAGLWIVLFQLVKMPPNALPDASSYPHWTVLLMVVMGSLVAPFMEEAGFRGYLQVALEHHYPGKTAVLVSSFVFMLAHLNHGIFWPKMLIYFLVGVVFGATAYLTNSTLPAIAPHFFGDMVFFLFIWPHDAARRLISDGGPDPRFWIHVAQALLFGMLAVWAFQRLTLATRPERNPQLP